MSKELSTEEKIKEAAQRVFMSKGFAGCSSREIAKEAGINVALLNYYFKSKGELYRQICCTTMSDFLESMVHVFALDLPLEQQIRIFIEREYDFLSKNPEICHFVFNDVSKGDDVESIIDHAGVLSKIERTGVFKLAEEAQEKGEMRKIDLISLTILVMSNCHFPVIGKGLITKIHQISDEQYQQHLVIHKQYVIEMIVGYLFPSKTK